MLQLLGPDADAGKTSFSGLHDRIRTLYFKMETVKIQAAQASDASRVHHTRQTMRLRDSQQAVISPFLQNMTKDPGSLNFGAKYKPRDICDHFETQLIPDPTAKCFDKTSSGNLRLHLEPV